RCSWFRRFTPRSIDSRNAVRPMTRASPRRRWGERLDALGCYPQVGAMVVVGKYLDLVAANLACAELEANGIAARVVEVTGFNPLLVGAAGGHELHVDPARADDARKILARASARVVDTEDENAVRCPRCELPYCYFGRGRTHGAPAVAQFLAFWTIVLFPLRWFIPERWHCERCEHSSSRAQERKVPFTPLHEDDPAPVFLLVRRRSGMGLFIGLLLGLVLSVVVGGAPGSIPLLVGPVLGYIVGRSFRSYVCS